MLLYDPTYRLFVYISYESLIGYDFIDENNSSTYICLLKVIIELWMPR